MMHVLGRGKVLKRLEMEPEEKGHLLNFRHRASCILGQEIHYSTKNAFYIFNLQIYFII